MLNGLNSNCRILAVKDWIAFVCKHDYLANKLAQSPTYLLFLLLSITSKNIHLKIDDYQKYDLTL